MVALVVLLAFQAKLTIAHPEVSESSGLVATKDHFWTHNDSGDGPYLYALDVKGKGIATVKVTGTDAYDWEDMAAGPFPGESGTWLYLADIGDNANRRPEIVIYAIPEPKIRAGSTKKNPIESAPAKKLVGVYPDDAWNAEALICDPRDGRLTIVTKDPNGNSRRYQFPAKPKVGEANRLQKTGEWTVPGAVRLVTGAAYRPDGKAIAILTYTNVIELIGDDPWKATAKMRAVPGLKQWEAITYAPDGKSLWLTSEGKNAPLVQLPASS